MVSPNNPWPFATYGNGHSNSDRQTNSHAAEPKGQDHRSAASNQLGKGATADTHGDGSPQPKPYFVPAGVPLESFPRPLQLAILEVIQPCYVDLVLGAATALERQAGASLCCILLIEVIEQYQLGNLVVDVAVGKPRSRDYDKQLGRYLRIVQSKEHVQKSISRLQEVRRKSLFFPRFSLTAPPMSLNSGPFSPLGSQPVGLPPRPIDANGSTLSDEENRARVERAVQAASQLVGTDDEDDDESPESPAPQDCSASTPAGLTPTQSIEAPSATKDPVASVGSHAAASAGLVSSASLRYCDLCYAPIRHLSKVCSRCRAPMPEASPSQQDRNGSHSLGETSPAGADAGASSCGAEQPCCAECWQPVPANAQSCPRCGSQKPHATDWND